jgi:hypothetical protein
MSRLDFKNFRFDPNRSMISDDEDEASSSVESKVIAVEPELDSKPSPTSDDSEPDEKLRNKRSARKAAVRSRYVESDSDESGGAPEDNPADPSFGGKNRVRGTTLPAAARRTNKATGKAQIVTMPTLRKETDEFRPLKLVDKGLFDANSSSQDHYHPLKKRNVVVLDDSSNGSSAVATSQLDDLQRILSEDSNGSDVKWLSVPKKSEGSETPKRKKAK